MLPIIHKILPFNIKTVCNTILVAIYNEAIKDVYFHDFTVCVVAISLAIAVSRCASTIERMRVYRC